MATLSSDGKSVTVVRGDTLWGIAATYLGAGIKYKQLAAINNIPNPDLIYVGQVIRLTNESSGSGGSSSSTTSSSTSSNKPEIVQFGELSNVENTLFATWTWGKESTTESYKVQWTYDTGNGIWLVASDSSNTVDEDDRALSRQSTLSIPSGARKVRFKVKPIAKKKKQGDTEVAQWTAEWSSTKTWTNGTPLATPGSPDVEIEKYKLTATIENAPDDATHMQFQIVKNNASSVFNSSQNVKIVSDYVSYACNVDAGGEYKVRCRSYNSNTNEYSEWSDYSGNKSTIPATPSGITVIRASSETSVYLEWAASNTATTYDIEYTTKKDYFDTSNQTTTESGIQFTKFELTGLESGEEYFFRVRANNTDGSSGWSGIKSVVIGKKPSAPTTWSSTTTAITGEPLNLYWVHNSEDGSSQTFAELEMYVGSTKYEYTIENTTDEEEKDKTSVYPVNTSAYPEGTKIKWRVRTAGITKQYGEWSIERTVDIYAPVTLELGLYDNANNAINVLSSFPCKVKALAGPNTQAPIGYHLVITSDSIYETVDHVGNPKTVNVGEEVYSRYFDITDILDIELSAGDIDLENNISYTISCTVCMDSGLTKESTIPFTVDWVTSHYLPNAEIGIDEKTYTATIRPYCESGKYTYYQLDNTGGVYTVTDTVLESVWGELLKGVWTETGEEVYSGMTADGDEIYYCIIEEVEAVPNVTLSVYRREFDGSFTELATGLDGSKYTAIVDPHPALDLARYRIVAVSEDTGTVTYYDPPGYPVGGKAVVIQWDEEWSSFEVAEEDPMEQPAYSGSLLKLLYNIDVSDSHKADISLIEYIGRKHPVSYYGTQLGETSNWSMEIDKADKETLYALRRLAVWMGDVYVREPSGSGYWASISVSFSQNHCEVTIPVTLAITRVEGGV